MFSLKNKKNLSNKIFLFSILIYLFTTILWLSYFEIKDPSSYDMEDIFFEGMYLSIAGICFFFINKLKSASFNLGWGLYVWGLVINILDEFTSEPGFYDTVLEGMIVIAGLVVITYHIYTFYFQQQKLGKRLIYLAIHDPITNSYNRRYLKILIREEEKRSKRYNHQIGLMMMDIDRFKELNDKFGHQMGDKVLRRVAKFLETQFRVVDRVIRYGGDEFLIVLPETQSLKDLNQLKERLKEKFKEEKFEELPTDFSFSLSIGCALWNPTQAASVENMIDQADKQMYQEKEKGKNNYSLSPSSNFHSKT